MLTVLVSALLFTSIAVASPNKTITTDLGTYVGHYLSASGQYEFLGVPYAQPPVGPLRLRRPVALDRLNKVKQTFIAGPSCLQAPQEGLAPYSEDCLYLRLHVPKAAVSRKSTKKLPVLVWFYGGGQVRGGIANYNGTLLVQQSIALGKPIIFVGVNYRLNSFGWLASKELGDEGNINLGLRDQRLALEWIQDHIDSFGGDLTKVTIFGESAGSRSVAVQLLGDDGNANGLFRGAIMQSAGPSAFPYFEPAGRELIYNEILSQTNCSSLACLRDIPAEALSNATTTFLSAGNNGKYGAFPFGPVLDAEFASDKPSILVRSGKVANVPLIIGNNVDEGTPSSSNTNTNTPEQLDSWLNANFAPLGGILPESFLTQVKNLYPNDPSIGSPFNTGNQTFEDTSLRFKQAAAIYGDIGYQASRRDLLHALNSPNASVEMRNNRTWSYLFAETGLGTTKAGVAHGQDVPFVFGTVAGNNSARKQLSKAMMSYWITFTYNLDPNAKGLPAWPTWGSGSAGTPLNLQFKAGNITVIKDDHREKHMAFINANAEVLSR